MANKYLIDLDLNGNEVQNFAIQTTGSLPSSPFNGQVVNHSGVIKVYDLASTTWKTVGAAADGTTITETSSVLSVGTIAISNTSGLQAALDGKVDDSQVLTNVPSGAVFTDTQLTQEQVEDYIGGLLSGSGATSVTYDDANNTLVISSTNTTYSAGNGIGLSGTTFSVAGGDGLTQEASGLKVDSTVVRTSGAQTIGGDKTFSNNVTVSGNLNVSGAVTTKMSETVLIEDNIITLNSNEAGAPSENAGIEVERGTEPNSLLRWNESKERWEFSADGSTYYNIPLPTEYTANTGDITGVTAGDGLSGGGTSGGVTLNVDMLGLEDLTDPNGDRIAFWDDSAGKFDWLTAGSNLTISGTTISATNTNTQLTNEQVEDIVGAMVTGNTESGISVQYQDSDGTLDFQTQFVTTQTSVSQGTSGTYNLVAGNIAMNFVNVLPIIKVYERDGSNYNEVHTSVVYNGTSGDMDIYLPAGDYKIVAQGERA